MKAKFHVENVQSAEPALALSCTFSQRGGLIGSGLDATWRIQDLHGAIPETAARIMVIDGHFTLEAAQGAEIRINGAHGPVAPGRPIILSDKDRFEIGALECSVELGSRFGIERQSGTMEAMVGGEAEMGEALVIDGEFSEAKVYDPLEEPLENHDPIEAMEGAKRKDSMIDPLAAFAAQDRAETEDAEHDLTQTTRSDLPKAAAQGADRDMTDKVGMSFSPRKVRRDQYGFEELEDSAAMGNESFKAQPDIDPVSISTADPVDHVALRPLARALGLNFGPIAQGEADQLLAEIGTALRAAISGLNHIYAARSGQASSFPLAAMHMHAIEDNPLRFSHDTEEALHALFAKRGAVHLSAPAAVSESIAHLDHHQNATEDAVNKALDAVLAALKPRALERRFANYTRDAGPKSGPERDAWCWQMYKAYFAELSSKRQRGLQMLFWEVFGYEYQALMRAYEAERDYVNDEAAE